MSLFDLYSAGKIGHTMWEDVTNNVDNLTMLDNRTAQPAPLFPTLCVLRATVNTNCRQGNGNLLAPVITVGSSDFLLIANTYWPMVLEDASEINLFVVRSGATNGTIYSTNITRTNFTVDTAEG